jgi:hypothetical protein
MQAGIADVIFEVNYFTTHFTDMCTPHFFFRFRTAFDGRRSTQGWLQNLALFQV